LFAVTILPFSTKLLIQFTHYRAALLTYWFNIFALGGMLYACWARATRAGLVDEQIPEAIKAAICRRIIHAQSLYAFGAALCVFSTYFSIGFIVLVQLYYALAPGFGPRNPTGKPH
jgi:uncharacterized membrane protein